MRALRLVRIAILAAAAASPAAVAEGVPGFAGQSCLASGCHADKARGRVVHPPAEDESCDVCHEQKGDKHEFELAESSVKDLCVMCHDDPTADAGTPHEAVELFGCDGCHDPHASENRKLLVEPVNDLCTGCHTDQGDELGLPHVHGAVTEKGCTICHDPHASAHPRLLLAEGNALCLACHGPGTGGGADAEAAALFEGRRSVEASFLQRLPRIPVDSSGRGHPVVKHPVRAEASPLDPKKPMWCGTCHRPHAASHAKLLFARPGFMLCIQCHK
ncbi:MAG: hypothetical protein D6718_04240 [Acidobacteria bacterium]|nr:MAG: hypothetical protein D6718_04240 [Acidobacteriota bacterium]